MKKKIAIALVVSLVVAIGTGCNKQEQTNIPQEAAKTDVSVETSTTVDQTPAPAAQAAEEAQAAIPTVPKVSKTEIAKKVEQKSLEIVKPEPAKAVEQPSAAAPIKTTETTEVIEPAKTEEKQTTVTFVDNLGKTVTLHKNPQRVVCLYSSYLDLWDLSGGKVVGRADTKEAVPAAAKDVETVGLYTTPNLEKILALQPDLVLLNSDVSAQVELIPILEMNSIPYAALRYDTFKDYANMIRIYTELTEREDLYQIKCIEVAKKIDAIIAKIPKDRRPSALLLLGSTKSVSVRLPNTTVGEMLQDLGAVNIAYDPYLKAGDMQVFSMEKVIEKNPDFIFVQTMGDIDETTARIKKDIEANPAWSYLKAVKEGKYIFLEKDLFLFKPNDRYAEAYEKLAKMLYPDIFN